MAHTWVRENDLNEGGVTERCNRASGGQEVNPAQRAGGRRERKEQGSLEDRNRTSGEEENRGREGEEE